MSKINDCQSAAAVNSAVMSNIIFAKDGRYALYAVKVEGSKKKYYFNWYGYVLAFCQGLDVFFEVSSKEGRGWYGITAIVKRDMERMAGVAAEYVDAHGDQISIVDDQSFRDYMEGKFGESYAFSTSDVASYIAGFYGYEMDDSKSLTYVLSRPKIDLSDDIYKQVAKNIADTYTDGDAEPGFLCSMKSFWMDGDNDYMDRCVAEVLGTDVDYVWENVNVDYDRLWDEAYETYTTGVMDFIDGELNVRLHGGIEYTYTFEADGGIRFCCTYVDEDKTFMIGEYGAVFYTFGELMEEVVNVNNAADAVKSLGYDLDSEVNEVCADYGVEMANRLVDESEDGYGDLGGDEGEGYIKYDRDDLEREVRWNRSDGDDIAAYYNEDDAVERINDDNVLYAIEDRMKAYHPGLRFYCYINDTGDITMTWKPVNNNINNAA